MSQDGATALQPGDRARLSLKKSSKSLPHVNVMLRAGYNYIHTLHNELKRGVLDERGE